MSERDRVRKELEEKRAKLAELRRARDERKAYLAQSEKAAEVGTASTPAQGLCLIQADPDST